MAKLVNVQLPAELEARIAKLEGPKNPCPTFRVEMVRVARLIVNDAGEVVVDDDPVEVEVIDRGPNWASWLRDDCLPWAFAEADKIIKELAL